MLETADDTNKSNTTETVRKYNPQMERYNNRMHPSSPYFNNPPNFKRLADKYDFLRPYIIRDHKNQCHIDWSNQDATRMLTKALLLQDFGVHWDLPLKNLVPPVPMRLNYILWIHDLLQSRLEFAPFIRSSDGIICTCFNQDKHVLGIDIGVGASCIYPFLGCSQYGWRFLGTDIDLESIKHSQDLVEQNGPRFSSRIGLIHTMNPNEIFSKEMIDRLNNEMNCPKLFLNEKDTLSTVMQETFNNSVVSTLSNQNVAVSAHTTNTLATSTRSVATSMSISSPQISILTFSAQASMPQTSILQSRTYISMPQTSMQHTDIQPSIIQSSSTTPSTAHSCIQTSRIQATNQLSIQTVSTTHHDTQIPSLHLCDKNIPSNMECNKHLSTALDTHTCTSEISSVGSSMQTETSSSKTRQSFLPITSMDERFKLKEFHSMFLGDFTMCNPPFFDSIEKASANPLSDYGGSMNELVCDGGEERFVKQMVLDSLGLKFKICWYTTMVGKKSTIDVIQDLLRFYGITNFIASKLFQGKTVRWVIAWSFYPNAWFKHKQVLQETGGMLDETQSNNDGGILSKNVADTVSSGQKRCRTPENHVRTVNSSYNRKQFTFQVTNTDSIEDVKNRVCTAFTSLCQTHFTICLAVPIQEGVFRLRNISTTNEQELEDCKHKWYGFAIRNKNLSLEEKDRISEIGFVNVLLGMLEDKIDVRVLNSTFSFECTVEQASHCLDCHVLQLSGGKQTYQAFSAFAEQIKADVARTSRKWRRRQKLKKLELE